MAASESARIQRLIKSAEELAKTGDRQKALTELHKVLDIDSGNRSVKKRISELEREISAMRNFKKTRDSRTHKTGKSVSSDDFVEECIGRSEEAFKQGDEVRALQELERAKRHDPDNKLVRRKILAVRRQIKADNLYDLALAKLRDGDPVTAVKNARAIFKIWPGAPVLADLLGQVEAFKPSLEDDEIEDLEDYELEEVPVSTPPEEIKKEKKAPVKKEKKAPAKKEKTSPVDASINSIRGKISRSDYSGALAEARKASKKHPENGTISELVTRLENLAGGADKKAAAVPVVETEEAKKKKSLVPIIVAVLVVVALVVVFVVIKPFGGSDEPDIDPIEEVEVFQPYSVAYTVDGVEDYSVTVDGEALAILLDGSFLLEGDSESPRTLEVRSAGFETYSEDVLFESGEESSLTITLDSLGTSIVQVVLQAAGAGDGEVSWLVDGESLVENTIDLQTGIHVFQAVQEGFNSVPESILVDYSSAPLQISLALLSQEESMVTLALGGDIPGSAVFTIDGDRVGVGVRRISEVLPYGSHTLRVEVEDHEPWVRTINLTDAGYSATVSPVAITTTGRLLIAPEPWANVTIDGVGMGQTPMAPVELEEGSHTVLLTNPDYEDQTSTVTIVAGEDASVRYTAAEAQPDQPEEILEEQPVIPPFPISQVGPQVPGLAQDMGDVHGYVTLDVLVGTDGTVRSVSIVNDELGLGCGAAAEAAVSQWVFNPATQGGVPVEITTRVQVRFDVE